MYRVKTLNKIAPAGLAHMDPALFQVGEQVDREDAILVRSAQMADYPLPPSLLAIARAGAGTNNIPLERCSQQAVVVFNTPGANANAVKELVVAAMLLSSRDVLAGADWVREQLRAPGVDVAAAVERGKSAFAGPELYHKTLGVLGLGAIGALVANVALELGMDVYGYDPYLSVDAALRLDRHVHVVHSLDELYRCADYITLHVPYSPATRSIIDAAAIAKMKPGVRVLNLARGELVDDGAMLAALEEGRVARYVTDFPCQALAGCGHVIALPHLGASTPESEENCAVMAVRQLQDYLLYGNIRNSVNMPQVSLDPSGAARICMIHKNVPAMLTQIMGALSQQGINVENMANKSRGDYAYTMIDVDTPITGQVAASLRAIPNTLRLRVLEL